MTRNDRPEGRPLSSTVENIAERGALGPMLSYDDGLRAGVFAEDPDGSYDVPKSGAPVFPPRANGAAKAVTEATAQAPRRPQRRPVSVCLGDVEPEQVSWLWQGYIPLGKVTVLDSDPGEGKSTVGVDVAARVTSGALMPDATPSDLAGPADVIILSAEDGASDTIRPRADAAGADVERIHLLSDVDVRDEDGSQRRVPWLLPRDLDVLRQLIERTKAKLVIVDPLSAYLDGKVDSYRDQDVRGALRPLADLAEALAVAILIVRHLNKAGGTNAVYRGGGSIGIIGAARSGLLIGKDPDDDTGRVRVLVRSKGNLSAQPPALRYELVPAEGHGCARVLWLGVSPHTAATILAEPVAAADRTEREEAREIMSTMLAPAPAAAKTVLAACRDAGISERTARTAKDDLGVKSIKTQGGGWAWTLPGEGCAPSSASTALQPCSLPPEQDVCAAEVARVGQGCNPATEGEGSSEVGGSADMEALDVTHHPD